MTSTWAAVTASAGDAGHSYGMGEGHGNEPGTASRRTFVEVADTLTDNIDVIDFLQVLAVRWVELFEVDAAGIMLAGQDGSLMTVAASDERGRLLELFEIQAGEGPRPRGQVRISRGPSVSVLLRSHRPRHRGARPIGRGRGAG